MIERLTNPASLWAFAVAAMFVPGIYAAPFMPRWWAIAIGLPVVSRLDPRSLHWFPMWCLAGLLAYAALTLVWSPVLYGGMLPWFMLLLLAATMIAAAESENPDAIMFGFAAGIAVSGLLAVPQYFGWSPVVQAAAPAGLFYSSEVLAEVAAPVLVWALWRRLWLLSAALAIPLLLGHTYAVPLDSEVVIGPVSRVAWIAVLTGIACGLRPRWRAVLIGVACVVGSVIVMQQGVGKAESADERVILWGTALRSLVFFGRGLGWWFQAHPFAQEEFAHSDVLQTFVELGIGGLFLAAIPVFIWRRSFGERPERAAFAACMVEAAISFPLHLPANGFILAVLAGILARRSTAVHDPRLQGRIDFGSHVQRHSQNRRSMARWGGRYDDGVPVRSALAQYARVDSCGSRQSETVS